MSTFSKQTFRNLFVLAKFFIRGHVPDGRKLRMTNIFLYICFRLNILPQVSSSIELKQFQTYYTYTLRKYNIIYTVVLSRRAACTFTRAHITCCHANHVAGDVTICCLCRRWHIRCCFGKSRGLGRDDLLCAYLPHVLWREQISRTVMQNHVE